MKSLKVGMCGWRHLQSFYPPRTRPADMLAYYSRHFPLVEISTTFQGIPNAERVREWAGSVEPGFTFDVIAFGGLTLHQLRPGASTGDAKLSWTDVAVEPPEVLFDAFKESISPLMEADSLGLVILQFPPWFEAGARDLTTFRAAAPSSTGCDWRSSSETKRGPSLPTVSKRRSNG